MQRALAVTLAMTISACSFLGARIPSHRDVHGHLECPDLSPAADVVVAALALGTGTYFLAASGPQLHDNPTAALGYMLAGLGAAYATSAGFGYWQRARCKRLDGAATSPAWRAAPSSP